MDVKAIKAEAKRLDELTQAEIKKPYFLDVMAWFAYLGLLRHNSFAGRRAAVSLASILRAGELEPRLFELLPALIVRLPEAIVFTKGDIPRDLAAILAGINARRMTKAFRGVPPNKYRHWLTSPVFELAARRLHFRKRPRDRGSKGSEFASVICRSRLERAMTQVQMADTYGLSLRVLRDLEQGRLTPSLQSVIDVLEALDHRLSIV